LPSIPFIDGKLPKPDSLPFIKRRNPKGSGYRYWAVNPSGDYGRDCETGAVYAKMLLPFLKYNAGISMLGSIVLDMIEAGNDKVGKGLIVGFMSELSIELSQTRGRIEFFRGISMERSRACKIQDWPCAHQSGCGQGCGSDA
jgi:hypothetical protein